MARPVTVNTLHSSSFFCVRHLTCCVVCIMGRFNQFQAILSFRKSEEIYRKVMSETPECSIGMPSMPAGQRTKTMSCSLVFIKTNKDLLSLSSNHLHKNRASRDLLSMRATTSLPSLDLQTFGKDYLNVTSKLLLCTVFVQSSLSL